MKAAQSFTSVVSVASGASASSADMGKALLNSLSSGSAPSVASLLAPEAHAGDASPAWLAAVHLALDQGDPWCEHHIQRESMEAGIEHVFDPETHTWHTEPVTVKLQPGAFANGAQRRCYRAKKVDSALEDMADEWSRVKDTDFSVAVRGVGHKTVMAFCRETGLGKSLGEIISALRDRSRRDHLLRVLQRHLHNEASRTSVVEGVSHYCRLAEAHEHSWKHAPNFVLKEYMGEGAEREAYRSDVEMQMIAKFWGAQFNLSHPPKKVDVLRASLVELPGRPGSPIFACECFLEGEYVKYNSNSGFVSEVGRVTPQAFSHFTFVASKGALMVVDIQGVGDLYTDPQIHTADGRGFGSGNLGPSGMARFFASHVCSPLCEWLGLPHIGLSPAQIERAAAADVAAQSSLPATAAGAGATMFPLPSPDSPDLKRTTTLPPTRIPFHPDLKSPVHASSSRVAGVGLGHTAPRFATKAPPALKTPAEPLPEESMDLRRALSMTRRAVSLQSVSPYMTPKASPRKAAAHPDHAAVYHSLGLVHLHLAKHHAAGEYSGRVPDMESALFHLHKAKEKGNVDAIVALKNAYSGLPNDVVADLEDTVEPDAAQAAELSELAADMGDRDSMVSMAKTAKEGAHYVQATTWLKRVLSVDAESGVPDAARSALETKTFEVQAAIGDMLLSGGGDLPPNAEEAAHYFELAQEGAMAHPSGQRKYMEYLAKYEEAQAGADTVSGGGGMVLRLG